MEIAPRLDAAHRPHRSSAREYRLAETRLPVAWILSHGMDDQGPGPSSSANDIYAQGPSSSLRAHRRGSGPLLQTRRANHPLTAQSGANKRASDPVARKTGPALTRLCPPLLERVCSGTVSFLFTRGPPPTGTNRLAFRKTLAPLGRGFLWVYIEVEGPNRLPGGMRWKRKETVLRPRPPLKAVYRMLIEAVGLIYR